MVWLLFFLALLLVVGGLWWRRALRGQGPEFEGRPVPLSNSLFVTADARHATRNRPARKFWGKQLVVSDPEACPAAREMDGMYFRNGTAPLLPLPGCTRIRCTCELNNVMERRSGEERRSGLERREDARFQDRPDRRQGRDRRKDKDHYPWHSVS